MFQYWIFSLLILIVTVIENPRIVLRPGWIEKLSEKSGIHWTGLKIQTARIHFLEPQITLSWDSINLHENGIEGKAEKGDFGIAINFRQIPPRVSRIGPVDVLFDRISIP